MIKVITLLLLVLMSVTGRAAEPLYTQADSLRVMGLFSEARRQPVNTDMPWWSLPETIRAAALTFRFTGDRSVAEIITRCSHAFFDGYVRPECHQMAV